jgi:hypothetical protein
MDLKKFVINIIFKYLAVSITAHCFLFAVALDNFLNDPWRHHEQEQDAMLDLNMPVEQDTPPRDMKKEISSLKVNSRAESNHLSCHIQ